MDAYGKSDFEKALKDAFIGFDSTLVDPAVVEELKKLATDVNDGSETEDDADDEENLEELWEERDMDLNAVLEKYEKGKTHPAIERASGAKPSPFLKGRRNCVSDVLSAGTSGPSSSNCARKKLDDNEDAVSSTSKQKSEEIGEAASSSGSGSSKIEGTGDPSSTNETTKPADKNCSPDSSSTSKNSADVQMTNGDGSAAKTSEPSQENEISTNSAKAEKVSSSSQSGSQLNGEISSNSSDKSASNSNISSTKDFDSAESSTDDDDEYNEGEFLLSFSLGLHLTLPFSRKCNTCVHLLQIKAPTEMMTTMRKKRTKKTMTRKMWMTMMTAKGTCIRTMTKTRAF